MKKNMFWLILGIVMMLGMVGCPEGDNSSDSDSSSSGSQQSVSSGSGAPSAIAGKTWLHYNMRFKWDSDGKCQVSNDGSAYQEWEYYKIISYNGDVLSIAGDEDYKFEISGDTMNWYYCTGNGESVLEMTFTIAQ